jgi:hypothetical protein
MKTSVFAILLSASFSLTAAAGDKPQPAVNADNKETFATVSGWVHKEMNTGGRYEHLTTSERGAVDTKLTEMGELLEKHGSVASMTDDEKTRMFNSQEQVNAILAKRDGDRMICKSVAPVGSHIPVKTCKTARETEQDQKNVRQFMNDRGQITQKQGGN